MSMDSKYEGGSVVGGIGDVMRAQYLAAKTDLYRLQYGSDKAVRKIMVPGCISQEDMS